MGLLGKTLGMVGGMVGGITAASCFLGNKKKRLAELDTEFARATADYEAKKSKLQAKIKNGNKHAIKKLEALDREYFVEKAEYENKRKTLLPKKSKVEEERETKELEQRLDIEKAKTIHELNMDRTKTVYGLELEKDKNHHEWDLEDTKTIHNLELEKDKSNHEWDLEKIRSLHNMEMEKIELTSKLGFSTNKFDAEKTETNDIVCSNCGNKNAIGSKFCSGCGTPLNQKRFCKNCGANLELNSKFCSMCGSQID